MKKIIILLASLVTIFSQANAQFSLSTLNYSQDFNTLDTTSTASSNLPSGWAIAEKGNAAADNTYVGSNGNTNSGNTYSLGNVGSTERAIGSLGSGNNRSRFGFWFTNNTGSTIYSATVTYKCEQWRLGDTTTTFSDTTLFEHSTLALGIWDTVNSWINTPSLNMSSAVSAVGPVGAVDGNTAAYQLTKTGTINMTVPNGSSCWIRFAEINIGGSDDMLALDDLSITFGTIPSIKPNFVSFIPSNNATNLPIASTNLKVIFDKPVTLGTGNVYVNNITAVATQTIAASACSVNGDTLIIPNISLLAATTYAVQLDSTVAKYNNNNCAGIYDNNTWKFSTLNPYPFVTNLSPFDNSTNVFITSQLRMRFSQPMTAGNGSITLKNITAGTQQVFAVPSAQVTISNDTVIVSNPTLQYATQYAVRYDSSCFNANTYFPKGFYSDTNWNFTTENAPPPPVTSLSESFTGCLAPALGLFKEFSAVGNSRWRCTTFGHTDSSAININGANTTSTFDNEDWLISPKIDVSISPNPYLHYWTKQRFSGNDTKEVYISNNYISGPPSSATWALLNVPVLTASDSNWKAINNTSLLAYKASPFTIAFKYTSAAAATPNAHEWNIDDVKITEGSVAIANTAINNSTAQIVGGLQSNQVQLILNNKDAQTLQIAIVDMQGRQLSSIQVNTFIGKQTINLPINNLASGMYFVQISNASSKAVLPFVAQ
jgi:hypothetical protein